MPPQTPQSFLRFDPQPNTIHLSISKRYLAYPDSNIVISQLLTDTLADSIYSFDEYIEYDKNLVEFIDVINGTRTPSPDWSITKASTTPGLVLVSAKSSGAALHGPGEILRLLFHVLDTARPIQTADFSDSNAVFGSRLETTVISDTGELHIIDACTSILLEDGIPLTLDMQCAPNPASERTYITYYLPSGARQVQLRLYDLAGDLVRPILDADEPPGRHELPFDVSGLPNGTYFCQCIAGNSEQVSMLSISH